MNILNKFEENNISFYSNFEEKLNIYEINVIIKNSELIAKYYTGKSEIKCVDDYIDYIFYRQIMKISEVDINEISDDYKSDFSNAINRFSSLNNNYKIKDLVLYISDYYEDIFDFLKTDKIHSMKRKIKDDFIRQMGYLSNTPKHKEILDYLLEEDIVIIFDNIYLLNKYKIDLMKKMSTKEKLYELIEYRYSDVLSFLTANYELFKNEKEFTDILNLLIDYILENNNHIYQREKQCEQLVMFLKNIRDVRVRKIMKLHSVLQKEVSKEVQRNGIEFKQKIDLKDYMEDYKKCFKNERYNDYERLLTLNTVFRKNNNEDGMKHTLLIETIEEREIGITAMLTGEDPYFASTRIISVESYINIFNRFFYGITIKNMGYRRLEKLLNELIRDVFETLNIEYSEQERKDDLKGVMYAIKVPCKNYSSNLEKKYNYYINSFYIISYMEKILRKIYIAINEKFVYLPEDKVTMGVFLQDLDNEKLKTLLGKNLFKWMKYYLFNIINEDEKGRTKKLGHEFRNLMGHYRNMNVMSINSIAIHNTVIYLFINMIEALHLNILDYPSEDTENIVAEQMLKDDEFEKYVESKITPQGLTLKFEI